MTMFPLVSFRPYVSRCAVLLILAGSTMAGTAQTVASNDVFCATPPPAQHIQSPATLKMMERLDQLLKATNPQDSAFLNAELIPLLQERIIGSTNKMEVVDLKAQLAIQMARANRSEDALAELVYLAQYVQTNRIHLKPENRHFLRLQQAIALIRLGEQENCLINHTIDSCLLPIRGEGVHREQRGSRGAIQVLTNHLNVAPQDLSARWLLNIAYMTVGEYPQDVPSKWLIDPKAFESQYPLPRFPDVSDATGVAVDELAGGVITDDFDGDGLIDIMNSSWGLKGQLRFFHNMGNGRFEDRTQVAGLMGVTSGLNLIQTDYNNDGHTDVFILRGAWLGKAGHHPNSLLRNNGNGTFDDVTEEVGLLSYHPTQAARWFDFDGDGWLDLFIGNESMGTEVHPCELYRNNGNGTFTECAKEMGVDVVAFVKGVGVGDFNNDGRPDLYLSCRDQLNKLFRNDGPVAKDGAARPNWRFTDVTATAGVGEPQHSFPTWFWDYDNDGWEDIMVTGYAIREVGDIAADYMGLPSQGERARLFRNKGDGTFEDVSKQAGMYRIIHAMGANFGDLDNDGWLDAYFGTGDPDLMTLIPNVMLRNNGGKNFQDVTTAGGFGHLQKGHAVAFADFDNDGDQDIYADMGGAYTGDRYRNALFMNPGTTNHWIGFKLEGKRSNRAAIGARIKVTVETPAGPRTIYKTVGSGGSFGASPLRQHIGLADATAVKEVEIFWPTTGETQKVEGLKMDSLYRIRESNSHIALWELRRFELATTTNGAPHLHTTTPLPKQAAALP